MSRPNSSPLPPAPVRGLLDPVSRFLEIEAAGGFVLLACAVLALGMANSQWSNAWSGIWETRVRIGIGAFELDKPLLLWINDGLMTLFFFVVGLEIKREIVTGELRELRKAALPIVAAAGGMAVPAAIYWGLQRGESGERGWGVPMATDIAFVVGAMAMLGPRVPRGLKVLLLTLAIVDDIGAILVIAVVYTSHISAAWLAAGVGGFALAALLNCLGVRSISVYVVVGAGIWLAFLKSGVHPTVAGVMLGLMTPASALLPDEFILRFLFDSHARLAPPDVPETSRERRALFEGLRQVARESVSPLERLEQGLHGWVSFVIMPVFALANAGVRIEWQALSAPVALAVVAGLVLGKPLGIVALSWLAVKGGVARKMEGVAWPVLIGGGCLAGIGFTMSLFIAGLAFDGLELEAAKIGTLCGSAVSALAGSVILLFTLPPHEGEVARVGS